MQRQTELLEGLLEAISETIQPAAERVDQAEIRTD